MTDQEPFEGECDWCHQIKPDIEWRADPFQRDVYDTIDERWMCRDCYELRCDEI